MLTRSDVLCDLLGFGHLRTLLCGALIACGYGCDASTSLHPDLQRVTLAGRVWALEIADDDPERSRGLSGREFIDPNGGMIFIFKHAAHRQFWMRRCLVPIDLIFLDGGGRITAMHEMTPQPQLPETLLTRYPSKWPAQFAIELAGGTLGKLNLREGEKIELPLAALKKRAR